MAKRDIRITITSALNAAGINATKAQVRDLARSVRQSMDDVGNSTRQGWADIEAAWNMSLGAIRRSWAAAIATIKAAFSFETMTVQFKTLIGDMAEARQHMEMLQHMGDTPPFSLEQFAAASRSMMVMTDCALGFEQSLQLVGDAAAATGLPIETLGREIGKAYAVIRDGQPINRVAISLRNMGIITPNVAESLVKMQESGAGNIEVWTALEKELGKFSGAMKETESTGNGLLGALSSRWDDAVRKFGAAFLESSKGGLQYCIDKLRELAESGMIERWAATASAAAARVARIFNALGTSVARISSALGAAVGTMDAGKGMKSALSEFRRQYADWQPNKAEDKGIKAEDKGKKAEDKMTDVHTTHVTNERERLESNMRAAQSRADSKKARAEALASARAEMKAETDEYKKLDADIKALLEDEGKQQRKNANLAVKGATDDVSAAADRVQRAEELIKAGFGNEKRDSDRRLEFLRHSDVKIPKFLKAIDPGKQADRMERYLAGVMRKQDRGIRLSVRDRKLLNAAEVFEKRKQELTEAQKQLEAAKKQLKVAEEIRDKIAEALVPRA
ncbi:MAG: hypothetical protein J6Z49_06930 [Kiritimatiellae bacterium]|nr:hypothetical protein [Kiritimatiellia bacterium]